MTRVYIHGNQITLPDDLRRVLTTAENDFIEVEEVEEGLLLKRTDSARRQTGLANLRKAQAGVRYVGPEPEPSEEEMMDMVAEEIRTQRAGARLDETLNQVRLRTGERPLTEDEIVEMVHEVRRMRLTAWQIVHIKEALAESKSGLPGVPHEEVVKWMESWGTDHELPRPEPKKP